MTHRNARTTIQLLIIFLTRFVYKLHDYIYCAPFVVVVKLETIMDSCDSLTINYKNAAAMHFIYLTNSLTATKVDLRYLG